MGRIRILSDTVANKIAAGEVVERPASVVKELLENSLDAGATDLRIDVEAGGRRLIRIADDGCGMMRDDAMLAFERHATSKLTSVHELEAIETLGFRGEALPSIASVSRLVLETRDRGESAGTRLEITGGKLHAVDEAALPGGTTITVRDLFFNVPARKKFLRSEQTELAHIASLVTHYSLANPDKSFTLTHGERDLLRVAPVATQRERVFQVFGDAALEELIEVEPQAKVLPLPDGDRAFTVHGFISRPQVQKSNRNSIYLFVNRRVIRDRLLLHAISAAYHNLMPPASYPFALLFVDCDPGEVDVNVHPSKTEVRFRHASFVHDFVRDTLRETLISKRPAPAGAIPLHSPSQPAVGLPFSEFTQSLDVPPADAPRSVLPPPDYRLQPQPGPAPRFDFSEQPAPLRLKVPDTHQGFPADLATELAPSMAELPELRLLGQIHDSFILAAGREGLWIIDQHVAHERILFEKVLKAQARGAVEQQRLLMPIVLPLTPAQQAEYERIAADLALAGFETEPFGRGTIAIKAAPAALPAGALERVIYEIIEMAESELRSVSVEDLRRGIAASIACRAAIKINMPLDMAKMEWLLRELAATDYPMACPHGRPVVLRYALRDILRGFHRI
ncbi:MAG: DNA mismatch repair endonuclease MutL [Bryobacteraceae bacterium]|nr:DNA mismatch repair endonuclease MutL [Bryobacteraceae bacterium]